MLVVVRCVSFESGQIRGSMFNWTCFIFWKEPAWQWIGMGTAIDHRPSPITHLTSSRQAGTLDTPRITATVTADVDTLEWKMDLNRSVQLEILLHVENLEWKFKARYSTCERSCVLVYEQVQKLWGHLVCHRLSSRTPHGNLSRCEKSLVLRSPLTCCSFQFCTLVTRVTMVVKSHEHWLELCMHYCHLNRG